MWLYYVTAVLSDMNHEQYYIDHDLTNIVEKREMGNRSRNKTEQIELSTPCKLITVG